MSIRLSVSKTKTFLDCKKKYDFTYNIKLPRKEFEYHTFGKFCHKVLEDFHNAYINGSSAPFNIEMSKAFKSAVEEHKEKLTPSMKAEGKEIISKYLKLISTGGFPSSKVTACEKSFDINIKDIVVINGMIDRVQLDDDGIYHVCDYKTSKSTKYLKEDWFQLLTYAYVLLNENPEIQKVRASYIMLRHDFEYISKEFEREEILSVADKYVDYALSIINEKNFEPNPKILCSYCDFLEHCDPGKEHVGIKIKESDHSW